MYLKICVKIHFLLQFWWYVQKLFCCKLVNMKELRAFLALAESLPTSATLFIGNHA